MRAFFARDLLWKVGAIWGSFREIVGGKCWGWSFRASRIAPSKSCLRLTAARLSSRPESDCQTTPNIHRVRSIDHKKERQENWVFTQVRQWWVQRDKCLWCANKFSVGSVAYVPVFSRLKNEGLCLWLTSVTSASPAICWILSLKEV